MLMEVLATRSELWIGFAGAFVEHQHLFNLLEPAFHFIVSSGYDSGINHEKYNFHLTRNFYISIYFHISSKSSISD